MILRHVVEHVKAQHWFAVGIDFLIVVVGVRRVWLSTRWPAMRYWMSTMHVAQLIANDRVAAATALKRMITAIPPPRGNAVIKEP